MARKCSLCFREDIAEINKQILQGESHRKIARQFDLSHDAITRHAKFHIKESRQHPNSVSRQQLEIDSDSKSNIIMEREPLPQSIGNIKISTEEPLPKLIKYVKCNVCGNTYPQGQTFLVAFRVLCVDCEVVLRVSNSEAQPPWYRKEVQRRDPNYQKFVQEKMAQGYTKSEDKDGNEIWLPPKDPLPELSPIPTSKMSDNDVVKALTAGLVEVKRNRSGSFMLADLRQTLRTHGVDAPDEELRGRLLKMGFVCSPRLGESVESTLDTFRMND